MYLVSVHPSEDETDEFSRLCSSKNNTFCLKIIHKTLFYDLTLFSPRIALDFVICASIAKCMNFSSDAVGILSIYTNKNA